MTATLPEPVTKVKKKSSKKALRSKELIQSSSWALYKHPNKQIPTTDESIPSEPLTKQYSLNAEPASFIISGGGISVTKFNLQAVEVGAISKIDLKSPFEQLASKIDQRFALKLGFLQPSTTATQLELFASHSIGALLAHAIASKNPINVASKIEAIAKDQSDSLSRMVERIVAASHRRLLETVKSSVAASALKAREVQAIALQSDDAKQFSTLLDDLKSGIELPSSEAVDAVLEIQCLPIPEFLKHETISALVDFIRNHRATNSQKVLIAVGAAIRKVLLNLPMSDIGFATELIKSEGSLAVPIGVELEVAKMVVQRVVEAPSIRALQFPELADAMLCIAKLYSSAKLVNREFYNATALNSVLSCLLMQHSESKSFSSQILRDSPSWFSRLCSNRLKRIRTELLTKNDSNAQDLVKHLTSLPFFEDGEQKSQEGSGS